MPESTVEILLPTYNGSRFLAEQLDSLCRQTSTSFTLITRDDGSRDDSVAIVDSYRNRLSIRRIENPENKNLGAVRSFELLMCESTAGIILFCDQDDIWDEARVEKGITAIAETMKRLGNIPCAVFSDLRLFSTETAAPTGTYLEASGFNAAAYRDPYYIAFRDPSPGCAMTVNRALLEASLPLGPSALMHDWWLMLVASLKGTIVFLDIPLLRYRLHTGNTLGIAHDRPLNPVLSILSMINLRKVWMIRSKILLNTRQARAVFKTCGKRFSSGIFWMKFISGRYIFPTLARFIPALRRYSWKRSGA